MESFPSTQSVLARRFDQRKRVFKSRLNLLIDDLFAFLLSEVDNPGGTQSPGHTDSSDSESSDSSDLNTSGIPLQLAMQMQNKIDQLKVDSMLVDEAMDMTEQHMSKKNDPMLATTSPIMHNNVQLKIVSRNQSGFFIETVPSGGNAGALLSGPNTVADALQYMDAQGDSLATYTAVMGVAAGPSGCTNHYESGENCFCDQCLFQKALIYHDQQEAQGEAAQSGVSIGNHNVQKVDETEELKQAISAISQQQQQQEQQQHEQEQLQHEQQQQVQQPGTSCAVKKPKKKKRSLPKAVPVTPPLAKQKPEEEGAEDHNDEGYAQLNLKIYYLKCHFCEMHCHTIPTFNKHMWEQHQAMEFQCRFKDCGKTFVNSLLLRLHVNEAHPEGTTKFECSHCIKVFETHSQLYVHQYESHERGLFGCHFDNCTFSATKRCEIVEHAVVDHEEEIELAKKKMRLGTDKVQLQPQRKPDKVKKCVCPFEGCGQAYETPYSLKRHQRSHSTVRPYSCKFPDCNKMFKEKEHAIGHIRSIHLKLPRYKPKNRDEALPEEDMIDPLLYLDVHFELLEPVNV